MMSAAHIDGWLRDRALPLWAGTGIDPATGTAWEALDHTGTPLRQMTRRLRVQSRQAFCFATLGQGGLARQLFDWVMAHGFDPDTGHMAAQMSPDMTILSAPNDLYDLAFAGFAAAALMRAGQDVGQDLARIERAIASLRAPLGWFEDAHHRLPRRQNAHMHLFEMAVALYDVTRAPRFLAMADTCLALFRTRFVDPEGRLLEFYSADLTPLPAPDQAIEPGHIAEWIYLLDHYERVSGQDGGVDLALLWQLVLARRDGAGLLPDQSDPASSTRRLWPQTELLRAAGVMLSRGAATQADLTHILDGMWRDYLDTPVAGGWYDMRTSQGALVSDTMPASTFYHVVGALQAYKTALR
ncbi:MAG: AGE family epimerase/isomerase [Pseudomonadota bacterium]